MPRTVEKSSTTTVCGARARTPDDVTLTDILPTLRGSLPDPLDRPSWPADTHATLDDVVVQGLSLTRVARLLGSPLLFQPTATDPVGVVLLRVSGVMRGTECRRIHCGGDHLATVATVRADEMVWHEARLIGRVSLARRRPVTITSCGIAHAVDLPDDLTPGDVVAMPVRMSSRTPRGCRLLDRIEESPGD